MNHITLLDETTNIDRTRKERAVRVLSTDFVIVVVLTVLIVASWLPRMSGPIDLRWDGAVYYVLGTALAEGKGYRLLNEPGDIEAVQYPPLLPAMIAAHQLILGTSDPIIVGEWLRVLFFAIYTVYIFSSYILLRQFLARPYAFGATLLILLNLYTSFLSDLCFAEIPFALVTVLFVLCKSKTGRLYSVLAGMFAMAAYLLRTVGIAVLLAWIGESLLKGQYQRAVIRLAISLIPILAWNGYIYSVEASPSYKQQAYAYQRADYMFYNVSYAQNASLREPFSPESGKLSLNDLLERFGQHLLKVPLSIGEGVSAAQGYWHKHIIAIVNTMPNVRGLWRLPNYITNMVLAILGSLTLLGILLLFRQGELFIPLYIMSVIIAVCLTPWPYQWNRYWMPLAPFLALALFQSLLTVRSYATAVSPRYSKIVGRTIAMFMGLVFLCQVFTLYVGYVSEAGQAAYRDRTGRVIVSRLFFYSEAYRAMDAGLDWLMAHAQSNDIVAASMPHGVYLRTGLKAVMPPFSRMLDTTQALLDSVPVTYIIVDTTEVDFTRKYALPLLEQSSHRWELVYSVPERVLEIYHRVDG